MMTCYDCGRIASTTGYGNPDGWWEFKPISQNYQTAGYPAFMYCASCAEKIRKPLLRTAIKAKAIFASR